MTSRGDIDPHCGPLGRCRTTQHPQDAAPLRRSRRTVAAGRSTNQTHPVEPCDGREGREKEEANVTRVPWSRDEAQRPPPASRARRAR